VGVEGGKEREEKARETMPNAIVPARNAHRRSRRSPAGRRSSSGSLYLTYTHTHTRTHTHARGQVTRHRGSFTIRAHARGGGWDVCRVCVCVCVFCFVFQGAVALEGSVEGEEAAGHRGHRRALVGERPRLVPGWQSTPEDARRGKRVGSETRLGKRAYAQGLKETQCAGRLKQGRRSVAVFVHCRSCAWTS